MTSRFFTRSPILALAFASLTALSGCESNNKPEELTRVSSAATTGLQPGDVAVTCSNSVTDTVQIVSLVALSAGTDLRYSDNEFTGTTFNADELADFSIIGSLDAGAPAYTPGDEISFVPNNVGNGPEQAFIYQGSLSADAASYNLLWGFQAGNGGAWGVPPQVDGDIADGGPAFANISALPASLATANTHVTSSLTGGTFWAYTGITTGTKAALQLALANAANWTGPGLPDGGVLVCPGKFTVTDAVDAGTDAPITGTGGTDGGATGGADGAAGAVGTIDGGTGGADAGTGGAAGAAGTDAGTDVPRTDAGNDAGNDAPRADAGNDAGNDAPRTDAGNDAPRVDAGNDVKVDTGTTTPTDAKVDTGVKTDAGQDAASGGGGGGCSCSTAVGRDGLGASAWMLAIAGVLFTARRKNKKRK
jgi:hypothetical protein